MRVRVPAILVLGLFLFSAISTVVAASAFPQDWDDIVMEQQARSREIPGTYQENGAWYHYMTAEEMLTLKAKVGVHQPGVDYNVIVDGFGTGLAPPTEAQWIEMVGRVKVVESSTPQAPSLPGAYDVSTQSFFPKVGNQRSQGSCAAWAATYYAYGYLEAKDNNWTDAKTGNTSHLMSPAWTYNKVNGGTDSGSWMWNNFEVIRTWGVASLATMPYNDADPVGWGSPSAFREAPLHRASACTEYSYNGQQAVDETKLRVSQNKTVTFTIDAGQFSSGFGDGNYIISSSEYNSNSLNHAQTVVGYDNTKSDDGDTGAFKVVNSWGSSWGDSGYYWITYEAFKKISNGIGLFLTDVVDLPKYTPTMLAIWHFNSAPTRAATITLNIGSYPSSLSSRVPYFDYDSSHTLPTFMCFDVSEFKGNYDSGTSNLWLKVEGGGSATLSSFKVESYESGYLPGTPARVTDQTPMVPRAMPGYVTINFPKYSPISANQALDSNGLNFTSSGQAAWAGVNHRSVQGGSSMQSGDVGDQGSSVLQTTVSGSSMVSFLWKVSSEASKDILRFYIDGVLKASLSGQIDWEKKGYPITSGAHILKWEFVKDSSNSMLNDTAWLDKLLLLPPDDAYEENDNSAGAKTLTAPGYYPSLVCLDDDWFKVYLYGGDILDTVINLNASEGNLDLFLYDQDAITLINSSQGSTGQEEANLSALSSGYYYLLVKGVGGDFARYSLTLSKSSGYFDYGSNSSLRIISGTGSFLGVSPSSKQITVLGGTALTGTIDLQTTVTWSSLPTVPLIATDTWNSPASAFWTISSNLSRGSAQSLATINGLLVPSTPGTYYLIFAFRNESSGAHVASATSDSLGAPVWGDGNDLANLSSTKIGQAQAQGRTTIDWLMYSGPQAIPVPADALIVNVAPPDITPPTTSAVVHGTNGQNGWYRSQVMITLSAADSGGSGLDETKYRIDMGSWKLYVGQFSIVASGQHALEYYSTDNSGNVEDARTASIKIDMTSPASSIVVEGNMGGNDWLITPAMINLTALDTPSGIASIQYRIDGQAWIAYSSNLTISSEGAHTFEYYALDIAGNDEDVKTETIKLDLAAPQSSVELGGNQGSNGWYGSQVFVNISSSDLASGVSSIHYRLDETTWGLFTGMFVVSSEGEHKIEFNAIDNVGNSEPVRSVIFNIDTTPPTSQAQIYGEKGGEDWYRSPVVLNLTAQDAHSGVAEIMYSLDGATFLLYSHNLTISDDGVHTMEFYAVDRAGIAESHRSIILSKDSIGPQCLLEMNGTMGNESWFTSDVTIRLVAVDDLSGVSNISYRLDGGQWLFFLSNVTLVDQGTHVIEYYAMDLAGNIASTKAVTINIDKAPPSSEVSLDGWMGENGWFISSLNVTLTSSDPTSGVGKILAKVDDGAWSEYTDPLFIVQEGHHMIHYYALDLAGNREPIKSKVIDVERSAPQSNLSMAGLTGDAGWFISAVTIEISSWDNMSGVNHTYYRLNGEDWFVWQSAFSLADGQHIVDYYAVDEAGNTEAIRTVQVHVDTTPPVTIPQLHGTEGSAGWFVSLVTASLNAQDIQSGLSAIAFQVDSGPWTDYSLPIAFEQQGMHRLNFTAADLAGNQETPQSITLYIDLHSPSTAVQVSGDIGLEGWYTSPVNVTLDPSDNMSGTASTSWRLDAGDWSPYTGVLEIDQSGLHIMEFKSVDRAGNSEITKQLALKIDMSSPELLLSANGMIFTAKEVEIAWSSNDVVSDVKDIRIRLDEGEPMLLNGDVRNITFTDLDDGEHILEVHVTDQAGNEVIKSMGFTVDTNPLSPQGPYGPWLIIGLIALISSLVAIAFLVRKRSK